MYTLPDEECNYICTLVGATKLPVEIRH